MRDEGMASYSSFLKSLGFPEINVHHSLNHFDFIRPTRRILVIGPMGSGKTEFSARVWRDSKVARTKSALLATQTTTCGADRRYVFFIRSQLDTMRFPDCPADALPFRGGYEPCPGHIATVRDSFELEQVIARNPQAGTWVIDEAAFYDERLSYVIRRESEARGLVFICPSLMLNFRNEIFNNTARLLLDGATDIFSLSAYCDHADCLNDGYYSYRYYMVDGEECPAVYFDPLIIVGGDREKDDPSEPNYCTRCDHHHYLPGKEYTFMVLRPLGEQAARKNIEPLYRELSLIRAGDKTSQLHQTFLEKYQECEHPRPTMLNALKTPCLAEKALIFLYAEQNLLPEAQLRELIEKLELDRTYLARRLEDNHRPLTLI